MKRSWLLSSSSSHLIKALNEINTRNINAISFTLLFKWLSDTQSSTFLTVEPHCLHVSTTSSLQIMSTRKRRRRRSEEEERKEQQKRQRWVICASAQLVWLVCPTEWGRDGWQRLGGEMKGYWEAERGRAALLWIWKQVSQEWKIRGDWFFCHAGKKQRYDLGKCGTEQSQQEIAACEMERFGNDEEMLWRERSRKAKEEEEVGRRFKSFFESDPVCRQ